MEGKCKDLYGLTEDDVFAGMDSFGAQVMERSYSHCLVQAQIKIQDLQSENKRLTDLSEDQAKEINSLKELHRAKDNEIHHLKSKIQMCQERLEGDQAVTDLKSQLKDKETRLKIQYDWYNYLIAENRRLTEHTQWLNNRVYRLEDLDVRRERSLAEHRRQYQFLLSKHELLLQKNSSLEALVEGLTNEREVFDDLRQQYEVPSQAGILRKDSPATCSLRVRFDDEEEFFDCQEHFICTEKQELVQDDTMKDSLKDSCTKIEPSTNNISARDSDNEESLDSGYSSEVEFLGDLV